METTPNPVPNEAHDTADAFRVLLETSPDAIVIVDRDARLVQVNRAAEHIFGYKADELIGSPLEVLMPERFREVHRGHRLNFLSNPHTRPMGAGLELYGLRKDGEEFPVEISLSPVRMNGQEYVVSAVRDSSERRRVEAALRQQAEQLRHHAEQLRRQAELFDLAHDAIVVLDADRCITSWNRGAEALYGWSREEAEGHVISDLLHTGYPESLAALRARLERQGEWDGELLHTCRDGRRITVESRQVAVRDETGVLTGILEVNRDVTERRLAEDAIRRAKEEAEQANSAKSDFLSRMSHELRTPLNAILGFSQLLELDPLSIEQRESVDQILRAGRHLLDLINEVLDIARIEAGRMDLSSEPLHVGELLRETRDLIQPLAQDRRVRLQMDHLAACEHHVIADRQRLKQVLLNLLSNAIKYNRDGGWASVACEPTGTTHLRLRISDTGHGIPAERAAALFTPFERLGAEQTGVEGTGLGLALSKRLVEAMGGTVGYENNAGRGSTFWVELPLTVAPVERLIQNGQEFAPPVPMMGPPRTLLYIEDNLSNVRLIERIIGRWPNVHLVTAMQGGLGLDLAREHQPDLILLDLHLPDINGAEVLRRLQADAATSAIPVVVISADATPGQIERLLAAGARSYLTKPLDVRLFVDVVGEALGERTG